MTAIKSNSDQSASTRHAPLQVDAPAETDPAMSVPRDLLLLFNTVSRWRIGLLTLLAFVALC